MSTPVRRHHTRSTTSLSSATSRGHAASHVSEMRGESVSPALVEREGGFDLSSQHIRRQAPWDSHERGITVPWATYVKRSAMPMGEVRFDLGPRPPWVAKAPGTGSSVFERPPERPAVSKLDASPYSMGQPLPHWDNRFWIAHSIDRNPVVNGLRKGLDNRTGVGALKSIDPVGGRYRSP